MIRCLYEVPCEVQVIRSSYEVHTKFTEWMRNKSYDSTRRHTKANGGMRRHHVSVDVCDVLLSFELPTSQTFRRNFAEILWRSRLQFLGSSLHVWFVHVAGFLATSLPAHWRHLLVYSATMSCLHRFCPSHCYCALFCGMLLVCIENAFASGMMLSHVFCGSVLCGSVVYPQHAWAPEKNKNVKPQKTTEMQTLLHFVFANICLLFGG